MTKSKVGAEPKGRVKHVFTKDGGIHEGIHRDEPGWYNSNYHCYCFGYGYFFHRGKSLGEKLTPDLIVFILIIFLVVRLYLNSQVMNLELVHFVYQVFLMKISLLTLLNVVVMMLRNQVIKNGNL